jgi:hypothetical protein
MFNAAGAGKLMVQLLLLNLGAGVGGRGKISILGESLSLVALMD